MKNYLLRIFTVLSFFSAGLLGTASAQTTVTIGANSGANSTTAGPCPIQDYFKAQRAQYLYTAAELSAQGITAGATISQIGWVVNTTTITGHLIENYTIQLGNTGVTTLGSASWETGLTSVSGPTNYSYPSGTSGNILFNTSSFTYTGGNLVIEVCGGLSTGGYTNNPATQWTTGLAFNGSHTYRADAPTGGAGCGVATTTNSGTQTTRPRLVVTFTPGAGCSGTPTGGTTQVNSSNGPVALCAGGNVSFSVAGATNASGLTYQWQYSATGVGGSYSNIGSATNGTYTIASYAGANAGYYQRITTCTASASSATSAPVQVTTNSFLSCYCASSATNVADEEILNVTFGTLNNSSTCATTAPGTGSVKNLYSNYTNGAGAPAAPVVTQGSSVPFSVQIGTCGSNFGNMTKIFIDWNQNGLLTDPGEEVYVSTSVSGPNTVSGNITVPGGAAVGNTLMRVVNVEGGTAGSILPCGTYTYGETEDYYIYVAVPVPCSGAPGVATATATPTSVCPTTPFTLNATGLPVAGTTGITYQWQKSATGAGAWTNISGATTVPYTVNGGQTAATDYRLVVTCTNSAQSTNSTLVTVAQSALAGCYCTPIYTNGCSNGDRITNVVLGTLSNNSGATCSTSPAGFSDYTATQNAIPDLTQGAASTASVSVNLASGSAGVAIWIDYNDDGVFDAGEKVSTGAAANNVASGATATINITPNVLAPLGQHRMRVRMVRGTTGSAMDPCSSYANGETEAYLVNIVAAPACAGTPVGGTATTTNAGPVCPTASFVLNATGLNTTVTGITYQWQRSNAGANSWTDVSGATTASYTLTGQSAASDYRLAVTCANSGLTGYSTVVSVTQTALSACYCTPVYTTGCSLNDQITNFVLGSISNNSGTTCSSSPLGYSNYANDTAANKHTDLYQGSNPIATISIGSGGAAGVAIWIDYNDNGVFEASEKSFTGGMIASGSTGTVTINVPANAPVGQHRMRVRHVYSTAGSSIDPCASVTYGETEDYTVNILASTPCSATPAVPTATASVASVCSGSTATLNATNAPAPNLSGITYQWQSSPAGAGTWANISGATTLSYTTAAITASTDYRLLVTCGNAGGGTATSTPVTVSISPFYACYCTTNLGGGGLPIITNATIIGTPLNNNTTTSPANYYAAFPATGSNTATLIKGQTYTMTNTYSADAIASLWIDYDRNGTFDAGEWTQLLTTGQSNSMTFTVPLTAQAGMTGLRIRSRSAGNPNGSGDACSNFASGETKDFIVTLVDPVPCTGTPSAPTPTAPAAVCALVPITLDATGMPVAGTTGVTYQWQSSPAGAGTFTDIAGATSVPYTVSTGQSVATDYRLILTCTNAGGGSVTSGLVSVGMTNYMSCYCTPVYTTGCSAGDLITNFTVGTFTNNSGTTCSTTPVAYSDYTSGTQPQLAVGTNNLATLTIGSGGAAGVAIWIDYNDDGFFASTERSVTPANINASSSGTVAIIVPAGAPVGQHRMRLRLVRGAAGNTIDPCASAAYGETEDYIVDIVSTVPCNSTPGVPTASASAASVCPGTPITLTASGLPPASVSGITYKWQSSPAGAGTWTNLSGAFTPTYTVSGGQTVATDYRLMVTCNNAGGGSATSNVVAVAQNAATACYCVPTTTNAATYNITNFTTTGGIANINNTSSATTQYEDFSASASATAYPGNTIGYSMTMSDAIGTYGVAVWVDFNEDGIFQSGEQVVVNGGSYLPTPITGSFVIPAGITPGTKRMRILATYTPVAPTDPCANIGQGQYEDYSLVVQALTPCAGTPASPAATASVAIACQATSITLNATGLPAATISGITYQWQRSNAGANTFADITGATTVSYTFSGQTVSSDYRLAVICSNGGGIGYSNNVTVTQDALTNCYCTPAYTNGCTNGDVITNVVLGTLSNNSGTACTGSFVDYTALTPPDIAQAATATASVTIALPSGTAGVAIWIDYNDNGVFEPAEKYNTATNVANGATASVSITPPLNAPLGTHRMRIRMVRGTTGAAMDPCNNYANGETEAYTVNITPATSCSGAPNVPTVSGAPATPVCPTTSVTLTAAGNPTNLSGFTYQWERSDAGLNTFAPISGANATTYTFTGQTVSSDYRFVITCTNSGLSETSGPVNVGQKPVASCYCVPTTTTAATYNITNFTTTGAVVNINNPSTGTASYENFSATVSGTANQNSTVNYAISVAGASNYGYAIWVDYNEDGTFQSGEQVVTSNAYVYSPITGSFNIPANAQTGTKRMRVLISYTPNNPTDPCTLGSSGQYEDYTLVIQAPPACTTPTTQPTALNLTVASNTRIDGSFTAAAAPGASNYLVVRTPGSATAWNTTPTDGVSYTVGATTGNGVIIANGSSTTFIDNSVVNNTTYTYSVYAFNNANCIGGPLYNASSPLMNSATSAANYTAIQIGDWSNPATWDGNGVPANSCNSLVTITNGASVNLDVNANVGNILLDAGGTLTANANTLDVCTGIGSNGTVNIGGTSTLNIGTANTYNYAFNNAANSAVNMTGGTVNIKGQLAISGGNGFKQSGGNIVINPNDGTAFMPAGVPAFMIQGTTTGNSFTGGSITIVNPPHSSLAAGSTRSVSINSTNANTVFGGTHVITLGGGAGTVAGNSDGFVIETAGGGSTTNAVPLNNVVVNGGSAATGRWASGSYNNSTSYGTHIKGKLTINAGSEFRTVATAANAISFFVGGDIENNGTMTSQQNAAVASAMQLGEFGTVFTAPAVQTISGSGVFRNAVTGSTANFRSITLKNGNGVTFNTGSDASFSGTLTFNAGTAPAAPSRINMGTGAGAKKLIEITGASSTGASATAGWVVGTYQKAAATGTTNHIYPVGTASIYTPFEIPAGTVSTAGDIAVKTETGDEPNLASGTNPRLIATKSVNRYWTVTSTAVFTTAQVRMNYVSGDIDAGVTASNLKIGRYAAGGWSYPPVSGTPSTTQIASTNTNTLTDVSGNYAAAEWCTPVAISTHPVNKTICENGTFTLSVTATNALSYQWKLGGVDIAGANASSYTVTGATAANAGSYTVVVGGTAPCGSMTSNAATVIVTPQPAATISYASAPYCNDGGTATVTQTGTTGGTYSALPAGLSINATTGDVNLSASTANTYTVTYTVAAAGGCAVYTTTASITINPKPVGTFAYGGTPYCTTVTSAVPTGTGLTAGGTYSVPAGLTLVDAFTGEINPSTSTPGTYTVNYDIAAANGCNAFNTTASVVINAAPSATISYNASPYCTNSGTATVTQTGTTGGTYSSTTGLSIDATSGAIDLATSAAGTYTVTYTVAAAGGCAVYTTTASVTVTAAPSGTFAYSGTPYCKSTASALPTGTGLTAGGTYSATPGGLNINATTGEINPSASTARAAYTVKYTVAAANGCAAYSTTATVGIVNAPSATISYNGSPYCNATGTASVSRTGTTGGTYSATPAGLTLNATTGAVTLSTSTAGTYVVTYTVAATGGCAAFTATASITINQKATGTFAYSGTPFCTTVTSGMPTGTNLTPGGVFTAPATVVIDPLTGEIDPSASTPGANYTITYTVAAANNCPAYSTTTRVTIKAAPSATISYGSGPFCNAAGTAAVTRTGTTGGTYSATPAGLTISVTTGTVTLSTSTAGTYVVTYTVAASGGCGIYTTDDTITINPKPTGTFAYGGTPYCTTVTSDVPTGNNLTAGGTYSANNAGLIIDATTGEIAPATSTAGTYTVTYTVASGNGCPAYTTTASVVIKAAPSATINYAGSPYCSNSGNAAVIRTGTIGGTYSATPAGLNLNTSTGTIIPTTSTPGTYVVTYTVAASGGCAVFTTDDTITINPKPTGTFAYGGTPYCTTVASDVPTGNNLTPGGTYSSTTGLVIDATTGEIDPSASTAGTYTVTYTVAAGNGCAAYSTTASVRINAAPSATISYGNGPFCNNGTTAAVTRTGTIGGTYSATPAGLTISATTGTVTLSTSTAGTYVVTYTVAASGGCAVFTTDDTITINPKPTGTFAYGGTPYCGTVTSALPTGTNLTAGGTYTVAPAGLTIDATTGEINPSTSTARSYTVTYRVAAGNGCVAYTTTATVVIDKPVVTLSPATRNVACGGTTAAIAVSRSGASNPALTWNTTYGLYYDAAATTPYNGGLTSTVYAKLSSSMQYSVTLASGSCISAPVTADVKVTSGTNGLASSSTSTNLMYSQLGSVDIRNANCELIATVAPSGADPVSGIAEASTVITTGQQHTGVGQPYIGRVTHIEPVNNAANATGTITLYVTQQEFNDYTAAIATASQPGNWTAAPANSADVANAANIRVTQFHGNGMPGSAPGTLLTPTAVVFNNTLQAWAITFNVTGFSNFFVHTNNLSSSPLPVVFTAINATAEKGRNRVEWNVGAEDNVMSYEVEKDLNGSFATIGKLPAAGEAQYVFYDEKPISGRNTYRVKSLDVDGRYGYSPTATVIVKGENGFTLELFPNPTKDVVIVRSSGTTATEATVIVSELSGRMILRRTIRANEDQLDLSGLPAGTYMLQWNDGVHKESIRVTRQ